MRSLNYNSRTNYQEVFKMCQKKLRTYREKAEAREMEQKRGDLLGNRGFNDFGALATERRSTNRLKESRNQLYGVQEEAEGILDELGSQRRTIERMSKNLHSGDDLMGTLGAAS